MVSEEKRQYKDLMNRLGISTLYLCSSQTLRDLHEMTGQFIDPLTYQMSTIQDQSSVNFICF